MLAHHMALLRARAQGMWVSALQTAHNPRGGCCACSTLTLAQRWRIRLAYKQLQRAHSMARLAKGLQQPARH